jgi:hypothetical protein
MTAPAGSCGAVGIKHQPKSQLSGCVSRSRRRGTRFSSHISCHPLALASSFQLLVRRSWIWGDQPDFETDEQSSQQDGQQATCSQHTESAGTAARRLRHRKGPAAHNQQQQRSSDACCLLLAERGWCTDAASTPCRQQWCAPPACPACQRTRRKNSHRATRATPLTYQAGKFVRKEGNAYRRCHRRGDRQHDKHHVLDQGPAGSRGGASAKLLHCDDLCSCLPGHARMQVVCGGLSMARHPALHSSCVLTSLGPETEPPWGPPRTRTAPQ